MSGAPWSVAHRAGTVGELHGLDLPTPLARQVWVMAPARPALVLGSTQRSVAPAVAAGGDPSVDVVVRRSGGGAVLVDPGSCTWVDVLLPRRDPWWVDDVSRSARWLGWTWVAALASLGVVAAVHEGPMEGGELGAVACFAGVGPGEVVASGGAAPHRKLVGISQRRTRDGARFQCIVHHAHDPARLVSLLGPAVPPASAPALEAALAGGVACVPAAGDAVVDALLAALHAGA